MVASLKISVKFNCEICGKEVVRFKRFDSKFKVCGKKCAIKLAIEASRKVDKSGEKNSFWKGGRWKNSYGYILVYVPNHPFPNHQKCSYVFEHRLVMEQFLGRYLTEKERVHHINGIKDDNRIENLKLCIGQGEHIKEHILNGELGGRISYEKGKRNIFCKLCKIEIIPKSPHQIYCEICRKKVRY